MKSYPYIAFAVLALSFAACSQEDITPQGDLKDIPITIASAGVAKQATRSATTPLVGTVDKPATMSVFVTGGSKDKYNATNVKWKHDGTSWENKGTTMLYEGAGSVQKIFASSPYDENATGTGTITVTATDQNDWLVATATPLTSSTVSLTMTHALAKLVLVPTYGTEITENTITSVKIGGMYASGTLSIAENTWSGLPEANATLTMTNNELLVIPMESCTSFPITIIADGERTFTATASLEAVNNKLASGTLYKIKLQVGQDKVTLGGITAGKWATEDGGPLETE